MFELQVLFALGTSSYCMISYRVYQNHGIKCLRYYSLEEFKGNNQKSK